MSSETPDIPFGSILKEFYIQATVREYLLVLTFILGEGLFFYGLLYSTRYPPVGWAIVIAYFSFLGGAIFSAIFKSLHETAEERLSM